MWSQLVGVPRFFVELTVVVLVSAVVLRVFGRALRALVLGDDEEPPRAGVRRLVPVTPRPPRIPEARAESALTSVRVRVGEFGLGAPGRPAAFTSFGVDARKGFVKRDPVVGVDQVRADRRAQLRGWQS